MKLLLLSIIFNLIITINSFSISNMPKNIVLRKKNNDNNEIKTALSLIQGVGKEGCKLESPSGINMKSNSYQTKVFLGVFLSLFLTTFSLVTVYDALAEQFPLLELWKGYLI